MIITGELRNKILLHLPADYQKQGSEATGFSRSMIYKVLHEEQENDDIALWLITAASSEKEKREKFHKSLSKIAKQL